MKARWIALALVLCLGVIIGIGLNHHAAADDAKTSASATPIVNPDLQPVNSTKALQTAEQSVVRVLVVYRGYGGTPLDSVGMGSGFVVAPGYIITNYHVVEVPAEASSADVYIVPHKDAGAGYQRVELVKTWTEGDLALLRADGLKIPPLKLFAKPNKNERVVSMGYPDATDHLLNRSGTQLLEPSDAYVTQGSIALFASTNPDGSRIDTLFHTAPINHGNSGGPLMNECGQVVGVNTWTAPSTMSAGGDLDIATGQYVATRVTAVQTFLASAGVTPSMAAKPCYAKSEDEIVKDDALTNALAAAAEAQAARVEEQRKAETDRAALERWQLGTLVLLSVLVLILIGLIIRREMRHRHEIHMKERDVAPTAFSNEAAPKAKPAQSMLDKKVKVPGVKHPIPWGWIALGLVIIAAVAFLLVKDRDTARRLTAPLAATAAPAGVVHMACTVDSAASPNPIAAAGPIEFDFDAQNACVSGKTAYERQTDGTLVRFAVNEGTQMAARLELSADGQLFKRSEFRLEPDLHKEYVTQRNALGDLRCASKAGSGAATALNQNLVKVRLLSQSYLNMPPETQTVWRCKKADAKS